MTMTHGSCLCRVSHTVSIVWCRAPQFSLHGPSKLYRQRSFSILPLSLPLPATNQTTDCVLVRSRCCSTPYGVRRLRATTPSKERRPLMPASPADSHARVNLQVLSASSADVGASPNNTEQTNHATSLSVDSRPTNALLRPLPDDMPTSDNRVSLTRTQLVDKHAHQTSRSSSRKEHSWHSSASLQQEPQPLARRPQDMDGPPNFTSYTAQFYIIQQPDRARSCGNADRDRRCLDPPPVLKLEVRSLATGAVDIPYMKRYSWIVQCFLYSAESNNGQGEQLSLHSGGRLLIRGNMVGNAQYADLGIDGHQGESCYFCFPDLSFSTAGYYRLKFQWAWIDQNIPLHSHQVRSMGMMGFQISDVFRVYSAKDFPSMLPMTPISLALKRHGLWIRGGIQRTRRSGRNTQGPEQEEHGEADAPTDNAGSIATTKKRRTD
ncbi:velvet factor-domain-containing protein [Lipomyces chichibuensis]|uniref:velvet factor-domain-containing protein n=1 Tax=Lipomyces chichibuensis TaxID=1546026 RepID=UPI003342FD0B